MATKTKLMDDGFKEEVKRYALKDAEMTLDLFLKHGDKMPYEEVVYSRMTREMGMRGVPVNVEKLKAAEAALTAECERTKSLLPWKDEDVALLSLQAIRDQCAKEGIEAPSTFSEKSEEGAAWENKYADSYPWVSAVREYRKANKHLKTVQTMLARVKPDGWMPYELKFFGATTGRDSGSSGWNAQNIPKGLVSGVDLRSMIEAPDGKLLVSCDLSQIEARCLLYLAKDRESLDTIASGVDVYEAHARATMNYTDPRPLKDVDPGLRQVAKARVLGAGYGVGPAKFRVVAKTMAGLDISLAESEATIKAYRATNPKIVALWQRMDMALRKATEPKNNVLEVTLPSGRTISYPGIIRQGGDITAVLPRKGKMMRCKLYGALIVENITQGFARDVFMDRCRALEQKGYTILMRVHDEAVILVDEADAERARADIEATMSEPPAWCRNLPLGAEAKISKHYKK